MSGRRAKALRRTERENRPALSPPPLAAPQPILPDRPPFASGDRELDRVLLDLSAQALRYARGLHAELVDGCWQVWAVVGPEGGLGCALCGTRLDPGRPLADATPPPTIRWHPIGLGHPRIVLMSCAACSPPHRESSATVWA